MNREDYASLLMVAFPLSIIGGGIVGWVMNVSAVYHADFSHLTGQLVFRIIGIFIAPLGAILGWCG